MTPKNYTKHESHINRIRSEGRCSWSEFVRITKILNKYVRNRKEGL